MLLHCKNIYKQPLPFDALQLTRNRTYFSEMTAFLYSFVFWVSQNTSYSQTEIPELACSICCLCSLPHSEIPSSMLKMSVSNLIFVIQDSSLKSKVCIHMAASCRELFIQCFIHYVARSSHYRQLSASATHTSAVCTIWVTGSYNSKQNFFILQ